MTDRTHHGDSLWRTTRRSLVDRAREAPAGATREEAWRQLVEDYRRPIKVCMRRYVRRHPDADEIVDGFFGYLFTEQVLEKFDGAHTRFRVFLQAVMRNYARAKQREYKQRGEPDSLVELIVVDTPPEIEVEEERTWARSVLDRAADRLRGARSRDGRILLQFYGIPPERLTDTGEIARKHELSLDAVHQAISRARQEFRRLIEAQIALLVDGDADREHEKRLLIGRLLEARPDLLG